MGRMKMPCMVANTTCVTSIKTPNITELVFGEGIE